VKELDKFMARCWERCENRDCLKNCINYLEDRLELCEVAAPLYVLAGMFIGAMIPLLVVLVLR
jgi:hypothetical protein